MSNTTKIVINECYGGFSLSPKATRRYLELCGIPFTEKPLYDHRPEFIVDGEKYTFPSHDMKLRSDPRLVQVVEELGEEANAFCSQLTIEELEKGTLYRITNDEGIECIVVASKIKWMTA